MICPSCGKDNPDGFAFCGFCTAPLAGRSEPLGVEERKVVSVLFCDLVGFTAASELQDPEDVRARIRPYHARLRQEIERYGGSVEKFIGDAVMAVFGAPVAHEDDAERAVRAGLRILDAIAELNEGEPGLDLHVRVGIDTGEAVVALGTRPEQGEGMVTGDVVNTAARIQTAAPVDGVAVAESTYRTTNRLFEYEPLAPATVKGKAEPLALWRARAPRARFGPEFTRRYTVPLVDRELERTLLIGAFERAAQQRSVQVVTVVGEPGVGKTRLVAELAAYLDAKPEIVRWRQGRCLPYGEGITFWALGEIVKAEAGILESDPVEVVAGRLEGVVAPEEPERQWVLQRLAPLVGLEAASSAERQELFTAWRRFLEGLAAARASVFVFEDLHWADDALLQFLEYLADWSEGVPLLILCAARPELYERRPGWGAGQRNSHTINLSPLSDQETAELVSHLTDKDALDPEMERAILDRAEGNPLYAEEIVRLLSDRDPANAHDAPLGSALPDSLQSLIAARLDTLPPDRKAILQDAAVIGKVFWLGAVAEIGDRDPSALEPILHDLARKELIRPARSSSMADEIEYSFWHLLVRDVAYAQIPRAERARRHRSAAAWIERKGGERVEDLAEVLAHHHLQALELASAAGDAELTSELVPSARRFLALAGERALGLDTRQAETRLSRALELSPSDDPQRLDLLVRWADATFQVGRPRDAAETLDDVLDSLRAHGQIEVTARALQLRSRIALRLGEGTHVPLASEAVELLEREEPGPALVEAYAQLANAQFVAGGYAEAMSAADRAVPLARALGLPEPARALGYHGYARVLRGDADGIGEMERALTVLVERGAGRDAAVLQNNLAIARYPIEGPARSLSSFEDGIAFCEQRGLAEAAIHHEQNCPGLLVELGRPAEAAERARRLAVAAEASGDTHAWAEVRSVELSIRVARGEGWASDEVHRLVEAVRAIGAADIIVMGLASGAGALVAHASGEARALLEEVTGTEGGSESSYYARWVAAMVRTALAAGDSELATRLANGLHPRYPLDEHARVATTAQLIEQAGDHARAATLYADAAARWARFGNVAEQAYALLGEGRCLLALARPEAQSRLRAAQEIFDAMGYRSALGEARLLAQTPARGR
ncbi:MAG TPA: adenylate/guanylate cyclase domain-containing protein [Actinomycetota bacterium]|nr:adenylate/guanylate cyclase domain-containing protein [Actinomycetota bacterium]